MQGVLQPLLASAALRAVADSIKDYAIFLLDSEGVVLTWNTGAQRIKGYAAGDIVGQSFSRFYTDEDRAARRPQQHLMVAAREGRIEIEGWRVRKDGSRFWAPRSEEHTSELQSLRHLVCRLLLEKKKESRKNKRYPYDSRNNLLLAKH